MLNHWKRGASAAAALILALSLALPALAADPLASGGFADVRLSAQETDDPQETVRLALYRRDGSGTFRYGETFELTTPVNRATSDLQLHLTPRAAQVSLTVDYLTDLNGDGVYELLGGQTAAGRDVLSAGGTLVSASAGVSAALSSGREYTITGESLLSRGEAAIQDRTAQGSASYLPGVAASQTDAETVLYLITVSYRSPADGEDYALYYYLRLYEQLPAPSAADYQDVPEDAWYYGAVDYAVSNGYLSGVGRSQFAPQGTLTRAMLAQVLYQVAGRPEGGASHYDDVDDGAWCYAAVSWASGQGILEGSGGRFEPDRAPSRQELAVALYRFALSQGLECGGRADLSPFADAGGVAPWARSGVEWAVSAGLLAGEAAGDGTLRLASAEAVTRAEFAAVLQTLCQRVLP